MPVTFIASTWASESIFARVNAFMGEHVDCSEFGENVIYDVRISDRTGECVVHVQCTCGVRTQLTVRSHEGRALMTAARRHLLPSNGAQAERPHYSS